METNQPETKTTPLLRYEISRNVHPQTNGEQWGWIVLHGTRIRVATYSGDAERKLCDEMLNNVNRYQELLQENARLEERLKEVQDVIAELPAMAMYDAVQRKNRRQEEGSKG